MAEEVPLEVELIGELGQLASVVQSADISTAFVTGRSKDGPTMLVPLMTCQLNGRFGRESEATAPSATLAYDNVAFLLMQFSEEYLQALDVLELMAPGGLGSALPRLGHAAEWLQEGSAAMQRAAHKLNALAAQLEPAPTAAEAPAVGSEMSAPAAAKPRLKARARRLQAKSDVS